MQIIIDIPKEFEMEFELSRFEQTFNRIIAEIDHRLKNHDSLLCGNYEKETIEMLLKAFEEAIPFSTESDKEYIIDLEEKCENLSEINRLLVNKIKMYGEEE